MSKQSIQLSEEALDEYDFFRISGQALKQEGAAYISGNVPDMRMFALANLCEYFYRRLYFADMFGEPRGQMAPPREVLHSKGYYVDNSQIDPPQNVPDEIAVLYLHARDEPSLKQALVALSPQLQPHSVVWMEGGGASRSLAEQFSGENTVTEFRGKKAWYWTMGAQETSSSTQGKMNLLSSAIPISLAVSSE